MIWLMKCNLLVERRNMNLTYTLIATAWEQRPSSLSIHLLLEEIPSICRLLRPTMLFLRYFERSFILWAQYIPVSSSTMSPTVINATSGRLLKLFIQLSAPTLLVSPRPSRNSPATHINKVTKTNSLYVNRLYTKRIVGLKEEESCKIQPISSK